jgi:hypothetical protein
MNECDQGFKLSANTMAFITQEVLTFMSKNILWKGEGGMYMSIFPLKKCLFFFENEEDEGKTDPIWGLMPVGVGRT